MMKTRKMLWVMAATLLCGACLFASCQKGGTDLPLAQNIIGKWIQAEIDGQPAQTGMPFGDTVFSPDMVASAGSVHNWYILDEKYFYDNGRLVRMENVTENMRTVSYLTYSDGTTEKPSDQ